MRYRVTIVWHNPGNYSIEGRNEDVGNHVDEQALIDIVDAESEDEALVSALTSRERVLLRDLKLREFIACSRRSGCGPGRLSTRFDAFPLLRRHGSRCCARLLGCLRTRI